jgi:hypothetical protein
MNLKSFVSLLLILVIATSYLSFQVTALAPLGGGASYRGGNQDDGAYSIIKTNDHGFAIAGFTKSYGEGGSDMWLLKYAPTTMIDTLNRTITYEGEKWDKTYGGPEDDVAKCVIQTADGGLALAGYINSSINGLNMWLVKTDSNGTAQWDAIYGGLDDEMANGVVQTEDGGYLIVGYTESNGQSRSTLLVKTDSFGNVEWNRTTLGQGSNSIIESNEDTFALTVNYPNAFGFVKINASGEEQLNQSYPGPFDEAEAQAIIQTEDEGYAIAGWTKNNSTGSSGAWLVKTDVNGIAQWDKSFEKLGVYSLIKTIDGGYAMTGDRACLIVTDSAGNLLMTNTYDGETGEGGKWFTRTYSLVETSSNHFYMAGVTNSSGDRSYQLFLANAVLKTDSTPPTVTIMSPENNKTYPPDNIPLTFYVSKPTQFLWYSLDGQNATLPGNTTLPTLMDGPHSITVYATDPSYNVGASEPVYFSSETIYFTIDSALTIAPPDNKSPTDHNQGDSSLEPLQTILIAAAIITVAALTAATAVYYKKRKTKNN